MPVKFTRRELWGLALAAMVAAVSLLVVRRYFARAFPEAGIRFELSRGQAAQAGRRFLLSQGLHPDGDRQATRFHYSDRAKTFLERELGLARMEKLLAGPLHLWRWQTRWFQPLAAEEMRVSLTPDGRLVGFQHVLANNAAGARLAPAAARALAENFLRRRMRLHPRRLRYIGMLRQRRPRRTDSTFTWAARWPLAPGSHNRELQRASYRYQVTVAGDRVSGYREFLKIPQGWVRRYQRLRSRNDTTAEIADVFLLMLLGALLVVLVQRLRRGDVNWRPAIWIGALGAVLTFLAQLNALPTAIYHYQTTQSWAAFLTLQTLSALLAALGVGAFLALLTAGAEPLYRERFPAQLSLDACLRRRGFRTKPFFWSLALGLVLACFFFAYQTVFYLIANHFGAWAPADVPYSSLLNTWFPWVFVMLIGFWPAIFEEFTFRMLAIPLLGRWFGDWRPGQVPAGNTGQWRQGRLWLAVVSAAFIWGFAHANYPNQPFYIRGLEVGLGGVLLGWMMIRFGILTTVVWHYTVDAVYTAMLLLRAHNAYLRLSGGFAALLAVLPLLVALAAYWRYGGFAPETGLLNAADAAPPPLPEVRRLPDSFAPAYVPISRRRWLWGAALACVALGGFFLPSFRWPHTRFRSTPAEAQASARRFLKQQGFALRGERVNVVAAPAWAARHAASWRAALQSLFQLRGAAPARAAAAEWGPELGWQVRYFRPLHARQYFVWLDPAAARVTGFRYKLRNRVAGAALNAAGARSRMAAWLAAQGIALHGMRLIRQAAAARLARRDYHFAWQAKLPGAAPIEARLTAHLAGDQPAGFTRYLRLPQAVMRRRQGMPAPRLLALLLKIAAIAVLAAWLIYLFFQAVRGRIWPGSEAAGNKLRWRPLLLAGVATAAASLLAECNQINRMLANYRTGLPWAAWQVAIVIGILVLAALSFFLSLALLAPLAVTAPQAFALLRRAGWRCWGRDAAAASLLGLCWLAGWLRWQAWINDRLHFWGQLRLPTVPPVDAWLPGAGSLLAGPVYALWLAALAGVIAPSLLWLWQRGRRGLAIAALALLWAGLWPLAQRWTALAFGAALSVFGLLLMVLLVGAFLRHNALSYFSLAITMIWAAGGWSLWQQPRALYRVPGAVLLTAALVWLLVLWFLGASRREPEAELVGSSMTRLPPHLRQSELGDA